VQLLRHRTSPSASKVAQVAPARSSPHCASRQTNSLTTVENLEVAPKLRKLYAYLAENGCIEHVDGFHEEYLSIFSRKILKKIKVGDASWESMVPLGVAEVIKRQSFFDYRAS
jgi:hypothetical protein